MKTIRVYSDELNEDFYQCTGEDEIELLKGLITILEGTDVKKSLVSNGVKYLTIEISEVCPHCGKNYIQKTLTEFI